MAATRQWTPEEDERLRQQFSSMTLSELAADFSRPKLEVRDHAVAIGLRLGKRHVVRWTESEDRQLKELLVDHTAAATAKILRRSLIGVKGRMHELSLRRRWYVPLPVGTERLFRDKKLLMRLITDDVSVRWDRRWRPVHHLVWEEAHGSVPEGHFVCFKEGMKVFDSALITLERLELRTPAEQFKLYSIHNLSNEMVDVLRVRAAVKRKIKEVEKGIPK